MIQNENDLRRFQRFNDKNWAMLISDHDHDMMYWIYDLFNRWGDFCFVWWIMIKDVQSLGVSPDW